MMKFWLGTEQEQNKIGAKFNSTVDDLGLWKLYKKALADSGHVTKIQVNGNTEKELKYYVEEIEKLGGHLIFKHLISKNTSQIFLWDNAILDFDYSVSNSSIGMSMLSTDEALAKKIGKLFQDTIVTPSKQGHIFAIMSYGSSLQLQRIGFAGVTLEKDNYTPDNIEDYNYVIKDLKSPLPSGRISIFDGSPGTGKTFLVRSILMDVPDAFFVLVPPAMVASLGGPEILPMLLQHKQSYAKSGPTVFILEDADACLAPRASDNMNSITSILNMGDGIFGSLFDIRIIATTNAKQQDMDSAIIRAGRLSKRVSVGRHNYEGANRIFQRLLPGKDLPKPAVDNSDRLRPSKGVPDFSLAEVYKAARDAGWEPAPLEDKVVDADEYGDMFAFYDDDEDDE